MKKPIPKIRVFGQRSIAPSFFKRTSIPVEGSSKNPSKKVEKCVSFSEFLDNKLNKSVLFKPKNTELKEGSSPFTSLVSSKDLTKLTHGFGMEKRVREEKKVSDGGLEKTMLQQFKPRENQVSEESSSDVTGQASLVEPLDQATAEEIELLTSWSSENNEDIIVKDDKLSKKRKDPFQGMENTSRIRKPVIVFGDDSKVSKPMQRKREGESSNSSKKQRPTYNHYANGSGWWDCDMEGVDSEEVGHSEVWEGVGSTTYGDIVDWH
ncbi:hypothetical protein AALP_AA4G098900 [Arabis alpina]|uniref:Uncharacterized protein n=1 Tax=Arabis alpina TaxID=50452 RepID=A0A087H2A7_ARAAL|nr:hypothetical protein AALP_AA4G098900 [Arabis alpina]